MKPRIVIDQQIARFRRVSASTLDDVDQEVELQRHGGTVFYAVDPHEIFDCCFPLGAGTAIRVRDLDLDQIADEQAALWDVFFERDTYPVVLAPYAAELLGVVNSVTKRIAEVLAPDEMIRELIRGGELTKLRLTNQSDSQLDYIVREIGERFNVALAAALGVYALGATRMTKLVHRRIAYLQPTTTNPTIRNAIREAFGTYKEDAQFVNRLVRALEDSSSGRPSGYDRSVDFEERSKRRANEADARTLDMLLHVNRVFVDQYKKRRLEHWCVLMYLSSAPRTEKLFRLPEVAARCPEIANNRLSLRRTRAHVFAYVLGKKIRTDSAGYAGIQLGLDDIRRAVESLGRVAAERGGPCEGCPLHGGLDQGSIDCPKRAICADATKVSEAAERQSGEVFNYKLCSSIRKYKNILDDINRRKAKKHERLIDFMTELATDENLLRRTSERMQALHLLVLAKGEVSSFLSRAQRGVVLGESLQYTRDDITGASQYLPTAIELTGKDYRDIVKSLVEFFTTRGVRNAALTRAYESFLGLDAVISGIHPEHETVRCLLYMAFPNEEGDRAAVEHCERLMSLGFDDSRKNLAYIRCWALRRLKRYGDAERLATKSLHEAPQDPRFFHGRGLNVLSWHADTAATDRGRRPGLRRGESDVRKAASYYSRDMRRFKQLAVVCWNDVAYFIGLRIEELLRGIGTVRGGRAGAAGGLALDMFDDAEAAVGKMLELAPERTWRPFNPEYFHTVAFLKFLKALYWRKIVGNKEHEIVELQDARAKIQSAVELSTKPRYQELRDTLDLELRTLVY